MVFSNGVAFFVMLMGAVALHAAGQTDVRTAAQAAQALRPLAGELAFALFAFGITRHRHARGAGARVIGRLRGGRSVRLARRARAPLARKRGGFYTNRCSGDAARHRAQLHARSIR
jgi:hypothetical protein